MATVDEIAKVKRDAPGGASLLTDEQIGQIFDENNSSHELAVAHIYDLLSADASSRGTIQIGKYKESFFEQAKGYQKTATLWRKKVIGRPPFSGGISVSDIETRTLDEDRNAPRFKKGLTDAN